MKKRSYIILFAALMLLLGAALIVSDRDKWKTTVYGRSARPWRVVVEEDGDSVTLTSTGSGKMYLNADDGLTFYYTTLDAAEDNFVLDAVIHVDEWTMSNGEDDGFGMMVCDALGENGNDANFFNNSYMVAVTKSEYCYDLKEHKVSNVGEKIIMRQGIVAQEKIGSLESSPYDNREAASKQEEKQVPLVTFPAENGAGTYNVIGGYKLIEAADGTGHAPQGTVEEQELLTDIHLRIVRDNTGYRIVYIEADGTEHSAQFYDTERKNLSAIDKEHIYVGFFVANRAQITVHDISLTVTSSAEDAPPMSRQIQYEAEPDYQVESADTSGTEEYELVFCANADGRLEIWEGTEKLLQKSDACVQLSAGEKIRIPCKLSLGENQFVIWFWPEEGYLTEPYVGLTDYGGREISFCVNYRRYREEEGVICVSPEGTATGDGSREDPLDIYTAVSYAAPGQEIWLSGGTYEMTRALNLKSGISGTAKEKITMRKDPESDKRPVLDFSKTAEGLILSGDFWILKEFDVTNTANGCYGIHLTGNHNLLEELNIYHNGNTGLHISSLSLTDEKSLWPSDNYILNCTSYGNCDDAYEDADGFACQFTAGPGNVFDGCIAHHNADDGWDLYAKVWLEPLGPVTIKNCIAYENGYLEDGTKAGNGNGFKLGGDGMPGGHIVENCLAFLNKAAGFTSNGCPDITLKDCTSVDNGTYNFRLYTEGWQEEAYVTENICSARTDLAEDQEGENSILAQELFVSTIFAEGYSVIRAQDGEIVFQGDFLLFKSIEESGARFDRKEKVR